jgi:GntR family transcriptional regulator/MocR family aminotransferase
VELHVSLVGRKHLTSEIYRQLRQAILDGRLSPGERLPPSRELAKRLSVARTTVMVAYDRLTGEGFVNSRVGAGTFVSHDLPRPASAARDTGSALKPRPFWAAVTIPNVFARPAEFDFRSGIPDATLFPYATWRRLMTRELRAPAVGTGAYGEPAGHAGLRHAIARHLGLSRGITAAADDITVTNGTQQALDVVARVLLAPGDRVAVEDPGYPPARRLFASLGADVVPVPVDREGLVVEAIPRRTRLVYVSPSHQFPLGMVMSLARRVAVLQWARAHDAAIVEDDYDSEFRFDGRPIEPLQTIDTSGRVIYVGSFSKTMLATLRLGFVLTPPSLSGAVRAAKHVTDWHTALPAQAALASFIDEGWFARHVRTARAVYQERHRQIVATLTREFTGQLEVAPGNAGLHVCALAPALALDDVADVVSRASAAGVEILPLSLYSAGPTPHCGLVVGYGAIPTDRIAEGLRRLRTCFE